MTMKITQIYGDYPQHGQTLGGWRPRLWQIVVRVETDAGVTGIGYGGGGEASLPIINGHFRELLLGRTIETVADITTLWDQLYSASIPYGRRGIAIMALSGVDLALWDALAKVQDVPVCHLISQQTGHPVRHKIRAYASGWDAAWFADQGFTAHKSATGAIGRLGGYASLIEWASDARTRFGPDGLLMVDCYMAWDAAMTRTMAAQLAAYDIYWIEDVLTPDHLAEQSILRNEIKPILLAGGEHEFTQHGFAEIARANALDIWQPDVTWCGGVTATLRIIELAQEAGVRVVLHRGGEPWGLHVMAAAACEPLAELVLGGRDAPEHSIWQGEPQATDGFLTVGDAPGFGVALRCPENNHR